jgi:hypothetical protein
MQLPRGTFREIKKHTKLGDLFEELQQTRFSGICTISYGKANGIIVFTSGKRILAEYESSIGDAAWDEVQKIVEEAVDAALSTLDIPQIQLSIEFNKSCRLLKVGKAEQFPPSTITLSQPPLEKKSPLTHAKPTGGVSVKNTLNPDIPGSSASNRSVMVAKHHIKEPSKKTDRTTVSKISHKHSDKIPLESKGYTHREDEKGVHSDETSPLAEMNSSDFDKDIDTIETMNLDAISTFDRDIDNFDAMDLETMTDKLRGDCREILKQLNLEHLKET